MNIVPGKDNDMPNESEWISMAHRQPTDADFVEDEWAVELLYAHDTEFGRRRTIYHLTDVVCKSDAHWRRVRLCPPPVVDQAKELDWSAWGRYVEKYPGALGGRIDFFEGRRTQREEIAAMFALEPLRTLRGLCCGGDWVNWMRELRRAVGLDR